MGDLIGFLLVLAILVGVEIHVYTAPRRRNSGE